MDGLKKRLNDSVQFKLSLTLTLAILMVALVSGVFSFMSAFSEANELQDNVLRQMAWLMERQSSASNTPISDPFFKEIDDESRVIIYRFGDATIGTPNVPIGGMQSIVTPLADGLYTLEVDGTTSRVLVKTTPLGERISVSQEVEFRDEIARESALRSVMPLLILVPVLLLIVADLVRKMFRPIELLSKDVDQRSEHEFHPVEDQQFPVEVRPFALAINRLLTRVVQSMEAQRRFVADAAHELRSPLTALSLQAERLADAEMSVLARERLIVLRQGIERGRTLLDQLLTLTRVQSAADTPRAPISVLRVYRSVLEDLMPLAEAKRIDIGVENAQDAEVWANELDMTTLVKNLVDNAIRYTPDGGRVDLSVSISGGSAILCIQDTGPGIPTMERERVFDAFYRVLGTEQIGSGLGLSIAQSIASRMGMQIRLDFVDEIQQAGLKASVVAPLKSVVPK